MFAATTVSTKEELEQIHQLNRANLKANVPAGQQQEQGFVTWLYSIPLLEKMHRLAPSVIVKDGDTVAGYALTTLKEAAPFHPDLQNMFQHLSAIFYEGKPLIHHHFYCMGQICVA